MEADPSPFDVLNAASQLRGEANSGSTGESLRSKTIPNVSSAIIRCRAVMPALKPYPASPASRADGAAKQWVDVHNDYGGQGVTRESETPAHRYERLSKSIARGMRNPINVYLVAQSCYRCHTVPSERLVNVGGHVAGSMDFEIVSWSQGTVRHNFVRTGIRCLQRRFLSRTAAAHVCGRYDRLILNSAVRSTVTCGY